MELQSNYSGTEFQKKPVNTLHGSLTVGVRGKSVVHFLDVVRDQTKIEQKTCL